MRYIDSLSGKLSSVARGARRGPALWLISGLLGLTGVCPQVRAAPSEALRADTRVKRAPLDLTAEFNALYDRPEAEVLSTKQRKELRGYTVLLVPGIVTSLYLRIGDFVKEAFDKKDLLDYLREAQEALKELGQDGAQGLLDRNEFNTQQTVAVNAERIAREVRRAAAAGKRVLLISHSKGGNDTLAALLLLQREKALRGVVGWISIQGVFRGTPVADEIMQSQILRTGAKLGLEQLGGTLDSLGDITTATSERFLSQHEREIQKLARSLPILSFASYKPKPADPKLLHPDTLLVPTRELLLKRGMENDGLIPAKSALLPHTRFILKDGIDHAETCMTNQPPVAASAVDRKKLAKVLMAMLLSRLPRS